MKPNQINNKQIISISVVSGLIGGALLITASALSTKGYWTIIVYTLIMLCTFLYLRNRKDAPLNFINGLIAGTLTFVIMSYSVYAYVLFFVNTDSGIPFSGHALRFAMIIGGGAAISAVLALIFAQRRPNTLQVS